jgi:zinc protease
VAWVIFGSLGLACVAPQNATHVGRAEDDDAAAPARRPAPRRLPRAKAGAQIRAVTLQSGMLVVLEQDPYATSAGVVTVVRGGGSADPAGAEGLAHLVEHLTFRAIDGTSGTPLPLAVDRSPAASKETRREKLIRYAAAEVNGLTSADAITFFAFAPTSRLNWLLELEAARIANPLAGVTDADVALERQVIGNESQLRDDPRLGLWASSRIYPRLFPADHPYARGLNGTPDSRNRLTLAEARAYAASNFRPERTTLLVSAPIAMTSLEEIVQRLPPGLVGDANHPIARAVDADAGPLPEPPAAGLLQEDSPLSTTQLWVGWTLPGGFAIDGAAEALLSRWVQEDLDLNELKQGEPHIRQVRAFLIPGQKASAMLIRVLLDDGADPEKVARVVSRRVSSLWTREPAQRPLLERLEATLDTEIELDELPQAARAVEQAQMAAFGRTLLRRADTIAAAATIDTADLATFAFRYLDQRRSRAVLFTPTAVTVPAPAAGRQALRPAALGSSGLFASAAAWDPMELPGVSRPVGQVVVRQMASGLTVIVARRRAAAAVAWLGFHGGYSDADPPLLVELALRIRPDAVEAPRHHALSSRAATRDASIETLEFPPADLEPALATLFAKATIAASKWPAPEQMAAFLAAVKGDADSATEEADAAFWRALFGEHPLARAVSAADGARLTRGELDRWTGRVYNLRNAALVVVGDVDPDAVYRYAAAYVQEVKSPASSVAVPALTPPHPRPATTEHVETVVTARPGRLADVRMACLLPPMTAADRADYETFRLAIQERLDSALRYERADGYGVSVAFDWLRGGTTYLQILTFVDADVLAETLAALRAEWVRWGRSGFNAGELNVGRWLYAGELAVGASSNHAIAFHLFNDWNADPTRREPDTFHADPLSPSLASLDRLFATCRANAVLGVTGNEELIRHALGRSWAGTTQ